MNYWTAFKSAWLSFKRQYKRKLRDLRNDAVKAAEFNALRASRRAEDGHVPGPQENIQ